MNYSIRILSADKLTVQDTGENLLSVQFNIESADGAVITTQRHGFPLDTTPEQVEGELSAVLAAFVKDTATQEASAEFAAQDAQADQTIQEIVGMTITG
jgi:predicted mannosyl-3-phosphoglycerate phosphatase (HAD superfamily)